MQVHCSPTDLLRLPHEAARHGGRHLTSAPLILNLVLNPELSGLRTAMAEASDPGRQPLILKVAPGRPLRNHAVVFFGHAAERYKRQPLLQPVSKRQDTLGIYLADARQRAPCRRQVSNGHQSNVSVQRLRTTPRTVGRALVQQLSPLIVHMHRTQPGGARRPGDLHTAEGPTPCTRDGGHLVAALVALCGQGRRIMPRTKALRASLGAGFKSVIMHGDHQGQHVKL